MTYSIRFTTGVSSVFEEVVEIMYVQDHMYRLKFNDRTVVIAINVASVTKKRGA